MTEAKRPDDLRDLYNACATFNADTPTEAPQCRAIIVKLIERIDALEAKLREREQEIAQLRAQVARLRAALRDIECIDGNMSRIDLILSMKRMARTALKEE